MLQENICLGTELKATKKMSLCQVGPFAASKKLLNFSKPAPCTWPLSWPGKISADSVLAEHTHLTSDEIEMCISLSQHNCPAHTLSLGHGITEGRVAKSDFVSTCSFPGNGI